MAFSKQPNVTHSTSTGEGLDEEPPSRGEAKWKRFHPLRVVRKIFRRRHKRESASVSDASKKSWSTSELQSVDDDVSGKSNVASLKIGLSVSHDSVFSAENSGRGISSESLNVPHCSSLSVHPMTVKTMFKDELFLRIRARHDSCDDGLPESFSPSPPNVDIFSQNFKDKSSKSSIGSLLSMGSSENDEISAGHSSGHSSRMSLIDRYSLDSDGDIDACQSTPLNHNAARHKIAIKPKRTHGPPKKRTKQVAAAKFKTLPITPEVFEENKTFPNLNSIEIMKNLSNKSEFPGPSKVALLDETSKESITKNDIIASNSNKKLKKHEFSPKDSDDIPKPKDNIFGSMIIKSCSKRTSKSGLEVSTMKSVNVLRNSFSENSDLKEIESLNVSSGSAKNVFELVKNIEKFESHKKFDLVPKHSDDINEYLCTAAHPNNINTDTLHTDLDCTSEQVNVHEQDKLNSSLNFTEVAPRDLLPAFKANTDQALIHELKKKDGHKELDVASEFVLNPRDTSPISINSSENIYNACENKHISFQAQETNLNEKLIARNEKHLFVSHNAPFTSDLKETLVTEAHNFVAVDNSTELILQVQKNMSEYVTDLTPCVNAVNMHAAKGQMPSTTFSSSSLVPSKCIEENTQTLANSNQLSVKNSFAKINKSKRNSTKSEMDHAKSLESSAQECISNTMQPQKQIKKTNFHVPQSNMYNNKKETNQKRVSVEIVPFHQRTKDYNYQSVSINNEATVAKSSVNNIVERKLSERKTHVKCNEVERPTNRHSFSGSVTGDKVENRQFIKSDKVQYPVQIRIHKSTPTSEGKEKSDSQISSRKALKKPFASNDSKFLLNSNNSQQIESKHKDEQKSMKWEVKIQPLSNSKKISEVKDKYICSSAIPNDLNLDSGENQLDQEEKSFQFSSVLESSIKNDNKLTKDASSGLSDDPEPELLRVFARRSIKQKSCDKTKEPDDKFLIHSQDELCTVEKSDHSMELISILQNSAVITITESTKLSTTLDTREKSKSFSDQVSARSSSPLKEVNLIRLDSSPKLFSDAAISYEAMNARKRLSSVPDTSLNISDSSKSLKKLDISLFNERDDSDHQLSSSNIPNESVNMHHTNMEIMKDNQEIIDKEHAPSWMQLAQQRRELREQRERILLGASPNSFIDASIKPSRSSKVWDMVNNFQKMQIT